MTSSKPKYIQEPFPDEFQVKEGDIEEQFITKLVSLKYTHRPDIRDRDTLQDHKKGLLQQLFPAEAKPPPSSAFQSLRVRMDGKSLNLVRLQVIQKALRFDP